MKFIKRVIRYISRPFVLEEYQEKLTRKDNEFILDNLTDRQILTDHLKMGIEGVFVSNKKIEINGWCFFDNRPIKKLDVYLVSSTNKIKLYTTKYNRYDVGNLFQTERLNETGFKAYGNIADDEEYSIVICGRCNCKFDVTLNNVKRLSTIDKEIPSNSVLLVSQTIGACKRYRCDNIAEMFNKRGIYALSINFNELLTVDYHKFKYLYISRALYYTPFDYQVLEEFKKDNKKIIFDMDDPLYDISYAFQNKLLKDNPINTTMTVDSFIYGLENSDYISVSTSYLKELVKKDYPQREVFINENLANDKLVLISKSINKADNEDNVILGYYSGSPTHSEDFAIIIKPLCNILKKHSQVKLLIMGHMELPAELEQFGDRVIRYDFVNWEELPEYIAKSDINLMPLKSDIFNECKSAVKWLEAGLIKVPSVATNTQSLRDVIKNNENGFLCDSEQEWEKTLEKLIINKEYRVSIGERVYQDVMSQYTTDKMNTTLYEIVQHN